MSKPKSYHESFARFFENPTRDGFREFMKTNAGELRSCDFKAEWPEQSGLSRHILGLANTGGGCLVVGVAEADDRTLDPHGLLALKDKADVTNGIKNYLPSPLLNVIDIVDFSFDASEYPKLIGKRFQVLFVVDLPTYLPFVAIRDGANVRQSAIYIRHEGVTEEANYDELQGIINRRLATGHSTQWEIDLNTHVEQLRVLYSFVLRRHERLGALLNFRVLEALSTPNPKYPQEDFEAFVVRMIEQKKSRIAEELSVSRAPG